ncbi:MAG: hydrogenase iron-sulfur subunit [Atribacteria sp.]|nr:hydrogenase iron-sulfur subunit [Candidatus Atribacteria bacterium]MBU4046896.1 hydrogenase iron-sulfur subunit [bacterium]
MCGGVKLFEPKIIGFCCNWCAYAGADLAGINRNQYPPNIRMIRVMCSGTIEPLYVVKAFKEGADGVFIGGCHPGDCHYQSGNYKTQRRIVLLKRAISEIGLDPRRIRLEWVSAAEGQRFARIITEFTEEIKKLGPNPLKLNGVENGI